MEQRIREICETRVRYGYRRVHVLLRREGWLINMKKTRRIYNELGLQLRNKHPKRRVKAKLREDRQEASGPNDVWAMDFVRRPIHASPIAARMWCRHWNGCAA
ncbi:transposase InsO family protein [Labrenzia sp. EL_142]|nr:transposase InsO family protein [Labrenzia sp. EL_142]